MSISTPTPENGKAAHDAVFSANNELLDSLEFGKRVRFQKLIDLTSTEKTFKNKKGEIFTAPDNFIQLNATKELCKLAGDYPSEKFDVGDKTYTTIGKLAEALERASAITERIAKSESAD